MFFALILRAVRYLLIALVIVLVAAPTIVTINFVLPNPLPFLYLDQNYLQFFPIFATMGKWRVLCIKYQVLGIKYEQNAKIHAQGGPASGGKSQKLVTRNR
mgnify:FL=1